MGKKDSSGAENEGKPGGRGEEDCLVLYSLCTVQNSTVLYMYVQYSILYMYSTVVPMYIGW